MKHKADQATTATCPSGNANAFTTKRIHPMVTRRMKIAEQTDNMIQKQEVIPESCNTKTCAADPKQESNQVRKSIKNLSYKGISIVVPIKRQKVVLANITSKPEPDGGENGNDDDDGCSSSSVESDEEGIEGVPEHLLDMYNSEEYNYIKSLDVYQRKELVELEENIKQQIFPDANTVSDTSLPSIAVPQRFKVLLSKHLPLPVKTSLINKMDQLAQLEPGSGEYGKLYSCVRSLMQIPFGIYKDVHHALPNGMQSASSLLRGIREKMDSVVYGQSEVKHQIMLTVAKWISNPISSGLVLGIEGPPGVGKTTLVKDCLAQSLGLPVSFIPLAGANDSSFLDGHNFTYEGSTYGKITDALIKSKCMNPVICFDELDKAADNRKGSEVFNVLIHLTDATQNSEFYDKYFADIPLDLSRCIMIFTYNDVSKIPYVLRDRMTSLKVKPYTTHDKVNIVKQFFVPQMDATYNMTPGDITFDDQVIISITQGYNVGTGHMSECSGGLRNSKRLIDAVYSSCNLERLMNQDGINLKFHITMEEYHKRTKLFLSHVADDNHESRLSMMYV